MLLFLLKEKRVNDQFLFYGVQLLCLTTDHPGVDSSGQIEKFQEKALMELQDYVQKTYPDDIYR